MKGNYFRKKKKQNCCPSWATGNAVNLAGRTLFFVAPAEDSGLSHKDLWYSMNTYYYYHLLLLSFIIIITYYDDYHLLLLLLFSTELQQVHSRDQQVDLRELAKKYYMLKYLSQEEHHLIGKEGNL